MSAEFEHGYAVVVGVRDYRARGLPELPLAVLNDAVDVARALWDPEICGYRADRVHLLLNEQATAEGIGHELEWLSERTTVADTAVVFFSGHGWQGEGGSYLAAHGAQTEPPYRGMISGDDLAMRLEAIRAGRLAVILDSCFSGGAEIKGAWEGGTMTRGPRGGLDEKIYERMSTGNGRALLASSGAKKESMVLGGARNSLFTSCLLRGLRGGERRGDADVIGIWDLFRFASEQVRELSRDRQVPVFKAQLIDNFPIALGRLPVPGPPSRSALPPDRGPAQPTGMITVREAREIHQHNHNYDKKF